jgi:hypothetical protein
MMIASGLAVVLLSYYFTFDVDDAEDFIVCFLASIVWSLVLGELVSIALKALFVWLAASEDFNSGEKGAKSCHAEFALSLLAYFPCVSAKQLLPTEL